MHIGTCQEKTEVSLARLHSRYNPRAEAERYIDSLELKETTECFILIEPGLGYIIPVLQERFEKSKIIVLHTSSNKKEKPQEGSGSYSVLYSSEKPVIKKFLEKEVPEIDNNLIRIIEWRPSMNYFKEEYITIFSQVVEFLKCLDAGKRTTAAFGKRWIKNFIKNLKYINNPLQYRQTSIPVIITGSGPSLEKTLPMIAELQNDYLIIAASSSTMALASKGIMADLIIATDGGNWALRHLYQRMPGAFYAFNLCAALPSQTRDIPNLIINDGSLWQNILLHEFSIPSVTIAQRGTVTATAVELALLLSSGSIYLAGLDFSNNDIRTHVKPYAFDNLFFGQANRFLPVYNSGFIRSTHLKDGGSMNIYASWFRDQLSAWPKRIFSLTEHNIFESAKPQKTMAVKNKNKIFNTGSASPGQNPLDILLTALKNPKYTEKLIKELSPLLIPQILQQKKQELEIALNGIYNG